MSDKIYEINKSIVRNIATFKNVSLEIYVPITIGDKSIIADNVTYKNFCNDHYYRIINCSSVRIHNTGFEDKELKWEKRFLTLNSKTYYTYLASFEKALEILNGDIYYRENGHLYAYSSKTKNITVKDYDTFMITPGVILDDDFNESPGIFLYINSERNICGITKDELKIIVNILNKVDLFLYSQEILNTFLLYKLYTRKE